MNRMEKWELAKARMYKRPALASFGYDAIYDDLQQITEESDDVSWLDDNELEDLIGDEELVYEFKMGFLDLHEKAENLQRELGRLEFDDLEQGYNDCTVALLGNRYQVLGFDSCEEDYYSLTRYEEGLAQEEAGKRLMRLTKAKMLSTIGQCMGILLAYYDLQSRYDDLHGVLEVIKGNQRQLMEEIKTIEATYERAAAAGFYGKEADVFDRLLRGMPERMWIE